MINDFVLSAHAATAKTFGLPFLGQMKFDSLLTNTINVILLIAGVLATLFLVFAGISYITAGGDSAKAEKARGGIVNAIIGIVIILIAFSITRWVSGGVQGGASGISNGGSGNVSVTNDDSV